MSSVWPKITQCYISWSTLRIFWNIVLAKKGLPLWGTTPLHQSKNDQILPYHKSIPHLYPHKVLIPPIVTRNDGTFKFKKMVLKISKRKLSWFFREFKKIFIFCLWFAFMQELHFTAMKTCHMLLPLKCDISHLSKAV